MGKIKVYNNKETIQIVMELPDPTPDGGAVHADEVAHGEHQVLVHLHGLSQRKM